MHGSMLVGSTEQADDMFLEPEPIWAFDVTITLRGAGSAELLAAPLHAALAAPLAPTKPPPVAGSSRLAQSDLGRQLLVGWASPPLREADEAAAHLAFILACQPKLGLAHIALRQGRSIAAGVSCALELGPQATVGWILALPIEPSTVADAEKAIDLAVAKLITNGPTDSELDAARVVLRTELTRERTMAKLRGLPRTRVVASTERILGALSGVDTVDVTHAAKALFSKDHRIVVTGG